jgi:peptidoglycan/LPS O-acetylase OafA/YrhL
MYLTLTTPALLFPAISLLFLAYTNRFLTIANVIRNLHSRYMESPSENILGQIHNLRRRVIIIRNMQVLGVLSFLFCVICMMLIFNEQMTWAKHTFGFSLFLLMLSLALSVFEIQISVEAIKIQLSDLEVRKLKKLKKKKTESSDSNADDDSPGGGLQGNFDS